MLILWKRQRTSVVNEINDYKIKLVSWTPKSPFPKQDQKRSIQE